MLDFARFSLTFADIILLIKSLIFIPILIVEAAKLTGQKS